MAAVVHFQRCRSCAFPCGFIDMRIGVVRRGYSRTGGAEAYLRRFADGLFMAGHEVVLFT